MDPSRYRWIAAHVLPHEAELRGWLRHKFASFGETDIDDLVPIALQHAILFELALAVAEDMLASGELDWDRSLHLAVERQRRHFDAQIPSTLSQSDKTAASARESPRPP